VAQVGLGRRGQTHDRCDQSAGDDADKSKLLHCGAFFFFSASDWRPTRVPRTDTNIETPWQHYKFRRLQIQRIAASCPPTRI
jgi:hypothetical protein